MEAIFLCRGIGVGLGLDGLLINTGKVHWMSVSKIYAMALAPVNWIVLFVCLPLSHSKFNKKYQTPSLPPPEIFGWMDRNC